MSSYKVRIEQTFAGEVNPHGRRREHLYLETELPFVPFIGMVWKDEHLGIDININGITWLAEKGTFLIKKSSSNLEEEELNENLKNSIEKGWKQF